MRYCQICLGWVLFGNVVAGQNELIGHWPLQNDAADHSAGHLQSAATGIEFTADGPTKRLLRAATFDGRTSVIDITETQALQPGTQPFSVAAWISIKEDIDDVPGDILSQYDSKTRTGFHLGLYSHGGVTNSQANTKQLHFGIDQGLIEPEFTDHGRLGSAVYVFSLCVHDGRLYASTCSAGADEAGHVFRFDGDVRWTDLGSPDIANSISAMTVFDGSLFVASSKYRLAGSSLAESDNPNIGGKVFRLGPGDQWISCGTVSSETEAVASLIEYRGKLYASSLYKPAGFFRYEGGRSWTACPTPDGRRVEALAVFNGGLFATCYDDGLVFRFDGETWQEVGKIPNATQTYGFAVHTGSLFVSEWPQAHVFRYAGGTTWEDAGKLGNELEAMPLLVYNGRMYGGTLPLAQVYRYDGGTDWTNIGRVDLTPDVKYRRAWSMAVYKGRLFVGTLPSGRVLSIEAGRNATYDQLFPPGWHHVAAVRDADRLRLYVDGEQVAESVALPVDDLHVSNPNPLRIGFGAQDHFQGKMADVRIYRGALSAEQIRLMAH